MTMKKTATVYLGNEKERCVAWLRPVDGLPVFLCAMEQSTYNDHPHLRDLFVELAQEVYMNRTREKGDSVCLRVREPLRGTVQFPSPP
jgi:hypothetical protein